jgi:putative inorganic carbon (HCO3(-)) transporter
MLLSSPHGHISANGRVESASPFIARAVTEQAAVTMPASYWLLLAFLVLLYANTPFLVPAAEVLRPAKVVAGLALLCLLGETMFGRSKFQFAFPEGAMLIAFLGAAAFSCLTALWPGYAVEGVEDLAKMALTWFFLVNCARSERALRGVMWVMVLGGLFPAAGTLKNYLTGNLYEGRAAWVGIFANPNEVAYALVILIPLAAYLATPRGWGIRVLLSAISVLFAAAAFVTFSRGGMIALVAVVALIGWRKKNRWMQGLTVLVLIGGSFIASRSWSRTEDFSQMNGDVTVNQRLATTEAGFHMFLDHPLLGIGFRCSVIAWPLYAPEGLRSRNALVTHNTFIQALSETGALGFIPFVLLIGFSIYHARRMALYSSTPDLGAAVEISLWGLVFCGMSGGYVLTWFPYLLLGLAAAARRVPMEME